LNSNYEHILSKLNDTVYTIESETNDVLLLSERCIRIVKDTLETLKEIVLNEGFKTSQNEIDFFKTIKPHVYSKLIYYAKLFSIESKRPRSSNKTQIKYLNRQIDKLQAYFNDNLEFYHYHRRGLISLDENYFIRGKSNIRLFPDTFHFFTDKNFSTSHDSAVATIMAYDMLISFLKQEIDSLENINGIETTIQSFQRQSKLFWTGSKTDLIELIYALHSSGAINSGTADIKEMAAVYEDVFNIELGHFYHTYVELKARKTNRTKFLDHLKESLVKKMDESDE